MDISKKARPPFEIVVLTQSHLFNISDHDSGSFYGTFSIIKFGNQGGVRSCVKAIPMRCEFASEWKWQKQRIFQII
jgi:hypothetical protein